MSIKKTWQDFEDKMFIDFYVDGSVGDAVIVALWSKMHFELLRNIILNLSERKVATICLNEVKGIIFANRDTIITEFVLKTSESVMLPPVEIEKKDLGRNEIKLVWENDQKGWAEALLYL